VRLRRKIGIGAVATLVLLLGGLGIVLSYDADCPAVAAVAPGKPTMRAIAHRCYGAPGEVLRVETLEKPTPAEGQVLIRVRATSVNPAEWYGATGQPRLVRLMNGIGAPKRPRLGFDMAGTVEAVGPNVTQFKPGDEVYGGVGGAFGEYVLAREQGSIVAKPANLSFEEAASIPIAAVTALQGLRDQGRLAAGQHVLINGASGGVGTYAVQIAKALGAEVTGVCSTRNVALVQSIGADHVIDYTQQDFTRGEVKYDLILDNVGNHSYFDLADVTAPHGIIVTVGGPKSEPFLGPIWRVAWRKIVSAFIDQPLPFFIARMNKADLEWLATLARDGKLRPVIDRRYSLEETGHALDYIGSQRARGKVVVTIH
jgi:NADPH:quinone reductase-like Zn-dependent oxidoreductase